MPSAFASNLDGEWPQWRGPARDGISLEQDWPQEWPKAGPARIWKASVATGFSGVSVNGLRLYTMGHYAGDDIVFCLEVESGREVWRHTYPCTIHDKQHEGGAASTPLLHNDRVYTLSRDGDVFCLQQSTGGVVWHAPLGKRLDPPENLFGFTGSPLLIEDTIVVDVGYVVGLDADSGEMRWKSDTGFAATYSSPVALNAGGRSCAAVFNATGLVMVDAGNGEEVCRKPWETPQFDTNTATPIVSGNRVFISSGYDAGCALLELKGEDEPEIVWENKDLRSYYNTFVLWQDHLYGFDDNVLHCWVFDTGESIWSKKMVHKGALVVVGGQLLILSERGEMVLADASPAGYRERGRTHVLGGRCWTIPALADRRIFCRNSAGDLVCLDVRTR